ncbi:MAG: MFS transporter [Planctomycetota bacterium]|nr:MAG: MFS transporter [Planctomycetota bacterium]
MSQITKFYLAEFLKTQRYFIPIMILLLQAHDLSYTEIFVLYAIQSAVVFLLEIPSGVIADQFGKKASIVFSRFCLIPAYLTFAFADTFWLFLVAMILMGINKAFKSGTHKAFIYDYSEQCSDDISFSEVIGKGKFWARIGEALACAAGGVIAARYGFNVVFFFALAPAVLNFINALTYEKIEEKHKISKFKLKSHFGHIRDSLREIRGKKVVYRIIINAAVFAFCLEAAEKFFQPYMVQAKIPIAWFGFIYMAILLVSAFGSRYAYLFEKKFARNSIANVMGWIAVIPVVIIGLKFSSTAGIFMFMSIIFLRNVRRPSVITELNCHIPSGKRATILSIDALSRALLALAFLPVIGYVSDVYSMYIAMLALGGVLVINQVLFSIPACPDDGETSSLQVPGSTED